MFNKKLFFSFKGRLNRKAFWLGYLVIFATTLLPVTAIFAIMGALQINDAVSGATEPTASDNVNALVTLIIIPFIIVYFWACIALLVKRFHDLNKSGWWTLYLLVGLIPIIGLISWIITIVIGCIKGTEGPNRFGADPLANTH